MNHAIGFEVTNIRPTNRLNMVEDGGIGKIAIKGEITRYLFSHRPVKQLDAQLGMVTEWVVAFTLLAFAASLEVERVVLASQMDIRGE